MRLLIKIYLLIVRAYVLQNNVGTLIVTIAANALTWLAENLLWIMVATGLMAALIIYWAVVSYTVWSILSLF